MSSHLSTLPLFKLLRSTKPSLPPLSLTEKYCRLVLKFIILTGPPVVVVFCYLSVLLFRLIVSLHPLSLKLFFVEIGLVSPLLFCVVYLPPCLSQDYFYELLQYFSIKPHPKKIFWSHFITHFDSSVPCCLSL